MESVRNGYVLKRYIRKHPLCEFCGDYAKEVHHARPVVTGGTDAEENLISLCEHCHRLIHKKITPIGELMKLGREHHDIKRGELSRLKRAKKDADAQAKKAERNADLEIKRAKRKAEEYSKYYTRYLDYKQNEDYWMYQYVEVKDLLEEEKARNEEKDKRIEKYRNNALDLLHRIRILEEGVDNDKIQSECQV